MTLTLGPLLAVALLMPLPLLAQDGPASPDTPVPDTAEAMTDPEALPEELAALTPDTEAGQELYRGACAQCHGRGARGTAVFPGLQGQSAETLAALLLTYRAGEAEGANAALMMPVARDLDDQQIVDVSAYLAETYP